MPTQKFDAIIVGARVAGSATAMQLARGGARVLLVDRAPDIGDTLSTHALMRPAIMLLEMWGLAPALLGRNTPKITNACFHYGPEAIDVPLKSSGDFGGFVAPRRFVLDRLMLEAAELAGAEVRLGTSFEGALFDGNGRITGVRLSTPGGQSYDLGCDLLVGADGRTSRVAKAVSAPLLHETKCGPATAYGYFEGLENDGYHWMFAPGTQAALIPTNDGRHCVFASCQRGDMSARFGGDPIGEIARSIALFCPDAAAQVLANRGGVKPYRFAGARGHLRGAVGAGWALVGDAGYFKDPSTAHGISDACLDAWRLSNAILSGNDLSAYETARNRAALRLMDISAEIGELDWSMDRLKALHRELSDHIRAETDEIHGRNAEALAA